MSSLTVEVRALPDWPDEAPTSLVVFRHADDHEELPSYDDLFGSTQRAMAFQTQDEAGTPPLTAEASPPEPAQAPEPPPPPREPPARAPEPPARAPRPPARAAEPPARAAEPPVRAPEPALGLLRLSTGDVVKLDRGVLLGRAPTVNHDPTRGVGPYVLRVVSPENDISRNHAEVLLRGSQVMVRDLGSTNGTTVALPGQEPRRLRPDDPQVIEAGTVVALANEVSFTFEVEA